MNFSVVKLIMTILVCLFIAFGLHYELGKLAEAKSYTFMFDVGYLVCAFLISRIVRIISDKRYAMIRSIYLEYVFSFVYFVFCLSAIKNEALLTSHTFFYSPESNIELCFWQ